MNVFRCIIMGAAGRDFHDFQTFFGRHRNFEVCCFTAHQIPFIEQRTFPRELAGPGYDADIPIFPEEQLADLIRRFDVDFVFFSYSDVSHQEVMHRASLVQAAGASFALLGPKHTELRSRLPVISVVAVRTGAGKSPISQAIARHLSRAGLRVAVIRHPMPYGVLGRQLVQRFASTEDLDRHECTLEEREEYEPYIENHLTVWAGVDYAQVLSAAEKESDVIVWDGGNNDRPFLESALELVVVDALRAGHEVSYYPGETNFLRADVIIVNKIEGARLQDLELIRHNRLAANPEALVVESDLRIEIDHPENVRGRRALVVEDGPTLTHGGMSHGAGWIAARRANAAEIIDPRPFAVGTIRTSFEAYPHIGPVLPALGYSEAQRAELAETIRSASPDVIVDASPARLDRVLELGVPTVRVRYAFAQKAGPDLFELVERFARGAA